MRSDIMQFGKYKIDEFYLIVIGGFLITSIFVPFMLISVVLMVILGLEKET
ncbi:MULTISPECIES: hypothetical protein [Staphylococcus]|uniref:hypothetical protein n=1 Tax=Staphylococcus TaxID=1279 RepID=UPI0012D3993F|nr:MULTISPECIES: hypothetical protein [Staphylococcus]MDK7752982.1 hypothetical protein [Staphylococcus sp. UMB10092B]